MSIRPNKAAQTSERESVKSILKKCLIGAGVGALTALVLMLLLSALCLYMDDASSIVPYLGYFCSLVMLFVSGVVSARLNGERGFLCGIISGLISELAILTLALAVFDPQIDTGFNFGLCAALYTVGLVISAIGGIVGVRMTERKKTNRHLKRK